MEFKQSRLYTQDSNDEYFLVIASRHGKHIHRDELREIQLGKEKRMILLFIFFPSEASTC